MRILIWILVLGTIMIFFGCRKPEKPAHLVYCDGLITDTAGTNDNGRVFFPSAFSPNGDGLNDILKPITQNISSISFTILDDYNHVIFNTSVPGEGWRTNLVPNAYVVYYYRIQATTTAQRKIGLCGKVYMLTCFPKKHPPNQFLFWRPANTHGFYRIDKWESGWLPLILILLLR